MPYALLCKGDNSLCVSPGGPRVGDYTVFKYLLSDDDMEHGDILDLTNIVSSTTDEEESERPFACPECEMPLILDTTCRQRNPFGVTVYYCGNVQCKEFAKPIDASLVKLPYVKTPMAPFNMKDDPSMSPIEFIEETNGLTTERIKNPRNTTLNLATMRE